MAAAIFFIYSNFEKDEEEWKKDELKKVRSIHCIIKMRGFFSSYWQELRRRYERLFKANEARHRWSKSERERGGEIRSTKMKEKWISIVWPSLSHFFFWISSKSRQFMVAAPTFMLDLDEETFCNYSLYMRFLFHIYLFCVFLRLFASYSYESISIQSTHAHAHQNPILNKQHHRQTRGNICYI